MPIVTLVGRRKDWRLLREAEVSETIAGNIVLTVGCIGPDGPTEHPTEEMIQACIKLHLEKIRMCDEVLLVSAVIGDDTINDIVYAMRHRKPVRFYQLTHESRMTIMDQISDTGIRGTYSEGITSETQQ